MIISSRKNPSIARYRELNRERKSREEAGEFNIEGYKLCYEAVKSGLDIVSAFITESAREKYGEVYELISAKTEVQLISEDISSYISDTKTPQGVFVTAKMLDKPFKSGKIESVRYILLDDLQDTGNIGTIIRTCDALGIDGIILSDGCADVYSPKIVRSAMGSLFRLPFMKCNLKEKIESLKNDGFRVYSAMLDKNAESLFSVSFPEKTAVVIGNEGNGVSDAVMKASENTIYIPIENAESLNAAVASSIICWEMLRQRKMV